MSKDIQGYPSVAFHSIGVRISSNIWGCGSPKEYPAMLDRPTCDLPPTNSAYTELEAIPGYPGIYRGSPRLSRDMQASYDMPRDPRMSHDILGCPGVRSVEEFPAQDPGIVENHGNHLNSIEFI